MEAGVVLSGKYRLVSLLGQGGMGSVWRAEHLALQAPVAIKLIDPNIAENPEALARFHREARSAATLRSPHVVQILDHGVDDVTRSPFIAMELLEGESLATRLEKRPRLTLEETTAILAQVSRALTRAHNAGIVHRDLKPDNIFLVQNEDEELAKVLDFGIAKTNKLAMGEAATVTGMVMGTAYYMSPEQIRGEREVDHRTDLWALGVIAYECLIGHRPFASDTLGGLILKICTDPLPVPSSTGSVNVDFDAWFERATARSPAERFQSAKEMIETLQRVRGGGSIHRADLGERGRTLVIDTNDPLLSSAQVAAHTGNPVYHTASHQLPAAPRSNRIKLVSGVIASSLLLLGAAALVWLFEKPESDPSQAAPSAGPVDVVPAAQPVEVRPEPSPVPEPAEPEPEPSAAAEPAPSGEPVVAPVSAPEVPPTSPPARPTARRAPATASPQPAPTPAPSRPQAPSNPSAPPGGKPGNPIDNLLNSRK